MVFKTAYAWGLRRNEVRMLDESTDDDLLARLHVRADPDGELGIALEAFVHRARSYVYRSSRIGGCVS